MTATRAPSAIQKRQGTVAGYVFWDQSRVAFNPSVPCQGLQVELDVITGTGMQKLATSNQFQFTHSQRPGPGVGLCGYSFSRVPEGVALQVQVAVGNPFGSHVAAKGPLGAIGGLIKIPGGQCNNSSNGITLSSTYLESGWVGCGDNAYNVNFELVPANTMATLPQRGTMLMQQASGTNTPPRTMLLQQPGGPVQSNGALSPAVRPVTPAPSTRPTASTTGGFTGGIRASSTVQSNAPPIAGSGSTSNGGSTGAPSALIGLLRKQGSLKIITGQRTKNALAANSQLITIARQHQQAGTISAGHTLASGSTSTSLASRMATMPKNSPNLRLYVGLDPLNPQEEADCQNREKQKLAPVIYRVNGQPQGQGVIYTPDPSGNPYTIIGCGFGSKGAAGLNSYGQNGKYIPSQQFQIQSWDDHEVVAALDPNTSGIPDWPAVQLYVQPLSSTAGAVGMPGSFYARREIVLLASIPQAETSLYSQGSPFFLSPVSDYYGLNGTASVMRQGIPPNSLAGQDTFTVQLSPGFVVDSTQTDLLVSTANSNVTIKPAMVNGNAITVVYPILSSGSGTSANYYSIYGLTIWVTGPVGFSPIAP
ncbi:MAG TPA: hypothetical protein VGU63_10380 [Candidatus Acidoferrales bacterium]|nr:hypothetical protein [Candidatus Acidoferrales bacterium]